MYLEPRFHCCPPLVDANEKRRELDLHPVPLSHGIASSKSASGRWCWEPSQSLIPELSLVLLVRRPTHQETTDVHVSLVMPPSHLSSCGCLGSCTSWNTESSLFLLASTLCFSRGIWYGGRGLIPNKQTNHYQYVHAKQVMTCTHWSSFLQYEAQVCLYNTECESAPIHLSCFLLCYTVRHNN